MTNQSRNSSRLSQDETIDFAPDCIYLNDKISCSILRTQRCEGPSCAFRCTHDQSNISNQIVIRTLNSLSVEQQKKIATSYYGGKMPWRVDEKSSR